MERGGELPLGKPALNSGALEGSPEVLSLVSRCHVPSC
jgi:hypothetical protein